MDILGAINKSKILQHEDFHTKEILGIWWYRHSWDDIRITDKLQTNYNSSSMYHTFIIQYLILKLKNTP